MSKKEEELPWIIAGPLIAGIFFALIGFYTFVDWAVDKCAHVHASLKKVEKPMVIEDLDSSIQWETEAAIRNQDPYVEVTVTLARKRDTVHQSYDGYLAIGDPVWLNNLSPTAEDLKLLELKACYLKERGFQETERNYYKETGTIKEIVLQKPFVLPTPTPNPDLAALEAVVKNPCPIPTPRRSKK